MLHEDKWPHSSSVCLTTQENGVQFSLGRGIGGGSHILAGNGGEKKNPCLHQESKTVDAITSHFLDWALPANGQQNMKAVLCV